MCIRDSFAAAARTSTGRRINAGSVQEEGDEAEGGRIDQRRPRRSTEGRATHGGPKATSATTWRARSSEAQSR
eukprot:11172990-Alexandrium_andersonii.AAC.1